MKLTAKVKLVPTPEQTAELLQTLEAAKAACTWISQQAWVAGAFSLGAMQRLTYRTARERFGLSAKVALRCMSNFE